MEVVVCGFAGIIEFDVGNRPVLIFHLIEVLISDNEEQDLFPQSASGVLGSELLQIGICILRVLFYECQRGPAFNKVIISVNLVLFDSEFLYFDIRLNTLDRKSVV